MNSNEKEIRFVDIAARLLRSLKLLVSLVLVFALLGAAFGAYKGLNAEKNATVTADDVKKAETDLKKAEKDVTNAQKALDKRLDVEIPDAETKVERAELLIQRRQSYIDNSLYYSMDPFHRGVSRLTFYVETENEYNPNAPWMTVDPQASIVTAYTRIYSVDTEILDNIRTIMDTDAEIQYIRELISVTDVSDQFVEIVVYYDDAQVAESVVNYLYETLMDRLNGSVGNYSANIIGRFTGYEVDWAMNDSHATNEDNLFSAEQALSTSVENLQSLNDGVADLEQAITDAQTARTEAQKNLDKLRTEMEDSSVNAKNIFKRTVKYGVIFAVLGLLIGCAIVLFACLFDNRVQVLGDITSRFDIPVLGVLPREKKHLFEKTICRLEGESSIGMDAAASATAQSILSVIGEKSACLISSVGNSVSEKLSPYVGDKVKVCGNILEDAEAVKALKNYDTVILVEQRGSSELELIDAEIKRAETLGKSISGLVLI